MTDRINALTITLDEDIREDDVQSLIQAMYIFQGVISVDINVSNMQDHVAEVRAKTAIKNKLLEVLL